MNRRNFIKTTAIAACSIPLISPASEILPRKYHKITKDWSIHTSSCTHWNDFNIYSKIGLSKDKRLCFHEMDNENEYILRSQDVPYIYVNKDKYYKIENYSGGFIDKGCHFYEVKFDIVKCLGDTPRERIIIISGWDYCIYALGRDYYKESECQFGKSWKLDRQEVYSPLTEEMHSKIKYFDFNRKTYQEYLYMYNTKLKELGLI